MKVLAIISRKGGAGKTTISTALAVAAESFGMATALFDLDPQASAALWADSRAEAYPTVVPAQAARLPALLKQADGQADLVVIDTPPEADMIASAAADVADAILIPCRPSPFDLKAIPATVRIARSSGKPFFVVINAAPSQGAEVEEMRAAVTAQGVEVAPVVLHHRKPFSFAVQDGRTAQEADPKGKAAEETRALFLWVCEKINMLPKQQANNIARKSAS